MQFPKAVDLLQQSIKAANARHQVIANNIANVNVPGFQGQDLSFEDRLKAALDAESKPAEEGVRLLTPHAMHIPMQGAVRPAVPVEPVLVPLPNQMRQDGNNIDMEDQMAKLAANQLWYQSLVRSISDEFSRLRTAISEGRR